MSEFNDIIFGNQKKKFKPPISSQPIDYSKMISLPKSIAKKAAEKKIEKGLSTKEALYSPIDFTGGVRDESGPIGEGADFFKEGGYRDSKGLLRDKGGSLIEGSSALTGNQEAGIAVAAQLTKGMGSGGSASGGAISGAASGAAMGMQFGPQGAVIGAVAGGVMGIMGASAKRKQRRREAEATAQGHLAEGEIAKGKAYGDLRTAMSDAFMTASTRKKTAKL